MIMMLRLVGRAKHQKIISKTRRLAYLLFIIMLTIYTTTILQTLYKSTSISGHPQLRFCWNNSLGPIKENEETENCLLRERQNGREIKEDMRQHI